MNSSSLFFITESPEAVFFEANSIHMLAETIVGLLVFSASFFPDSEIQRISCLRNLLIGALLDFIHVIVFFVTLRFGAPKQGSEQFIGVSALAYLSTISFRESP